MLRSEAESEPELWSDSWEIKQTTGCLLLRVLRILSCKVCDGLFSLLWLWISQRLLFICSAHMCGQFEPHGFSQKVQLKGMWVVSRVFGDWMKNWTRCQWYWTLFSGTVNVHVISLFFFFLEICPAVNILSSKYFRAKEGGNDSIWEFTTQWNQVLYEDAHADAHIRKDA